MDAYFSGSSVFFLKPSPFYFQSNVVVESGRLRSKRHRNESGRFGDI
jgi:hypothetical protein